MRRNDLHRTPTRWPSVVTQVHQGAIDVLGPVVEAGRRCTRAKFSMGTVLGLVAR
jgi:hypothetical protein